MASLIAKFLLHWWRFGGCRVLRGRIPTGLRIDYAVYRLRCDAVGWGAVGWGGRKAEEAPPPFVLKNLLLC